MPGKIIHVQFGQGKNPQKDECPPDLDSVSWQKVKIFDKLIQEGMVAIVLDATHKSVQVPSYLAQDRELVLNFSHRFGIKDFVYNNQGIQATLSFPPGLFFCVVPWESILEIHSTVNNQGVNFRVSAAQPVLKVVKDNNDSKS